MFQRNYPFLLLLSFCLILSIFSYSQQHEDLIGDWKIIKVELRPNAGKEEIQMLQLVKPIFLKSKFHFKVNNLFSFDSPDKDLATENGIWQFDNDKKYIRVIEKISKGIPGQLMGIVVKISNKGFLFFMEESSLVLTVARIE
jgi:hypothetical protein